MVGGTIVINGLLELTQSAQAISKTTLTTDQHNHAMMLLKKEQSQSSGLGPSSYAPIAKALTVLPEGNKASLRVKFDIAHFVATEKLAFTKYPRICELEAHHGVDMGTSYT